MKKAFLFLAIAILLPGFALAQNLNFGQDAEETVEVSTPIQQPPQGFPVWVPSLPLGQSRTDHDGAAHQVLSGEFAKKSELNALLGEVSRLRNELKTHPDNEELKTLLSQHKAEISKLLDEHFRALTAQGVNNGAGKKDPVTDTDEGGKPKLGPVAGVNVAEGKKSMETMIIVFAIVIALGAIAAAFFIGRGGSKGLADGNRAQSATFNPHETLKCGSFETHTTRDGSTLKAKSEGALQAEADTANALAVEARERSAVRQARLASAGVHPPATSPGSGGGVVVINIPPPSGWEYGSGSADSPPKEKKKAKATRATDKK